MLGSWSCQVPTCSASTLQFSQLTGTRTLTRLQTLRPAHGHDEFLLPGSFCIAGVLFSFWFYTAQHANNCSVKDHVVSVLVWRYLRISDFLEAQLTCTHSTSLKHKHSHMDFVVSSIYQHCSSVAILTLTNDLNKKDANLYCPAPNLEPTYQEKINHLNRNLYCRSNFKLNRCLNERHAAPSAHRAPPHIFPCIVLHCQAFSFVFNFFELPKCH